MKKSIIAAAVLLTGCHGFSPFGKLHFFGQCSVGTVPHGPPQSIPLTNTKIDENFEDVSTNIIKSYNAQDPSGIPNALMEICKVKEWKKFVRRQNAAVDDMKYVSNLSMYQAWYAYIQYKVHDIASSPVSLPMDPQTADVEKCNEK